MSAPDPLTALVSRSLRAPVSDVTSEVIAKDERTELERIRFREDGRERTLLLKRVPTAESVEVQLAPFLARKTEHVPGVFSRGIPPPAVPAWPWLLLEDITSAASACLADPKEIARAKIAIERAVAADGPALRALGVRALTPSDLIERVAAAAGPAVDLGEPRKAARWLARWPQSLVHGDLVCANAVSAERGVVLTEWREAHLGCGLLDLVRLAADIAARGEGVLGVGLPKLYAELVGTPLTSELLRAAELVDRTLRRYS